MIACGYVLQYLCVQHWLDRPGGNLATAVLSVLSLISIAGGIFGDVAAISSNLRHFPKQRGAVAGLLKALLGLSAGLLTALSLAIWGADVSLNILLVIGVFAGSLFVVCALFIVEPGQQKEASGGSGQGSVSADFKRISWPAAILVADALFLAVSSWVSKDWTFDKSERIGIIAFAVVAWGAVAAAALLLIFPQCGLSSAPASVGQGAIASGEAMQQPLLAKPDMEELGEAVESPVGIVAASENVKHMTLSEAVLTLDLWLLTVALSTGIGCGFLVTNNLGQMARAITSQASAEKILVTLFSVSNSLGRLSFAYLSDLASHVVLREVFLLSSLALMLLTFLVMSAGTFISLTLGSILAGLTFGSFWSLMPTIASDLFGRKYVAAIYGLLGSFPAVLGFALSGFMAPAIYQAHAPAGHTNCSGKLCYEQTYYVCAGLCGLGCLCVLWLWMRVRYQLAPNWHTRDTTRAAHAQLKLNS